MVVPDTTPLPRARRGLTRQELSLLLQIYNHQPWLEARSGAVEDLTDLCSDLDEQALVFDLLHRFEFVTSRKLEAFLSAIRDQILLDWKFTSIDTKIISLSDGSDSDSSQAILWHLKALFADKEDWRDENFVNGIVPAAKNLVSNGDCLVLVDEFCGTGTQASRRIKWLKKELAARGCIPACVAMCTVACLTTAKTALADLVDDYFSSVTLTRGISDHYADGDKTAAMGRMLRLESELQQKRGKRTLPSLGYKQSEALYSSEAGNTPNNVFPIFWWKWLRDGETRDTVVSRLL